MAYSTHNTLPLFESISGAAERVRGDKPLAFVDQVKNFDDFGRASVEVSDGSIPYLINEFWTSGQRQAHSLHEVSYRACFKPQLPEFFINRLTRPGDAVYDPSWVGAPHRYKRLSWDINQSETT